MQTASRTLVKSPPEVWEHINHQGRMEGLMSALVGHATTVEVYQRVEESKLAWKAVPDEGRIEVELSEKGWGTNVSVSAENGDEPTKLEGWLDAVLEELATPQKRPFEGMTEAPAGTLAEAASAKTLSQPAPVEAPAEEAPAEEAEPKPPEAEEPEPQQPEAEQPEAEQPEAKPAEAKEPELAEPETAATPQPEPAPLQPEPALRRRRRLFGIL